MEGSVVHIPATSSLENAIIEVNDDWKELMGAEIMMKVRRHKRRKNKEN